MGLMSLKYKPAKDDCDGIASVFNVVFSALPLGKKLKILFKSISASSFKCSFVLVLDPFINLFKVSII